MEIHAPYPATETIMILPEPELGNTEGLVQERDLRYTMNTQVVSYIRRTNRKAYNYQFILTHEKMREVRAFILEYVGVRWKIVDHHSNVIVGYCMSNPNELTFVGGKSGLPACTDENYTLNERVTWELEFEGTEI